MSAADLMDLLVTTAVPSPYMPADDSGRNDTYGWGVVSAVNLLDALYPSAEEPIVDDESPAACACGTASPTPALLSLILAGSLAARRRA